MINIDHSLIYILNSTDLLYEHKEVGELIEAELHSSSSDDCVNVFYHS